MSSPKKKYDPVYAREYYLRTRKLKGRKKARFSKPVTRTPSKMPSEDKWNLKGFDFRGGKWYDKSGKLVGTAKEEDSKITLVPGARIPLKDGTTYTHGTKAPSGSTKEKVIEAKKKINEIQSLVDKLKKDKASTGLPTKVANGTTTKIGAKKTAEQLQKKQTAKAVQLRTKLAALKNELDSILKKISEVSGTSENKKETSSANSSSAATSGGGSSDLTAKQKADAAKASEKYYDKNKDKLNDPSSEEAQLEKDVDNMRKKVAAAKEKLKAATEKNSKTPSKR